MSLLFKESTSAERLTLRRRVFGQQDGLALIPVIGAFIRRRVLHLLSAGINSRALQENTGARPGYLNIALRALASAGWIHGWKAPQTDTDLKQGMQLGLTTQGRIALDLLDALGHRLDRIESFLALAETMDRYLFTQAAMPEGVPSIAQMSAWCEESFGLPTATDDLTAATRDRIVALLEGAFAAPIVVTLARHKMFIVGGHGRQTEIGDQLYVPDAMGPTGHRRMRQYVLPAMASLGWYDPARDRLTKSGKMAAFFATAYGVTLSYLPLLRRAEELIFRHGDFRRMFPPTPEGHETHVDRLMNIWGSGGSHDIYFRTVDEVVVGLFERPDYPLAICDTGCGDGTFLRHLSDVLRDKLGWDFFSRPVHFVGSDLNLASREKTRQTLAAAGVPYAHIVDASIDINDPHQLDAGIRGLNIKVTQGTGSSRILEARDALHTNSMLVHNRTYRAATAGSFGLTSHTDGAFVDVGGYPIVGGRLLDSLVGFMQRWRPYVERFGWLFIELHTIAAARIAQDPSRSPTIAYDLTHGFSNQYTVERSELLKAAAAAGLVLGPDQFQAQFPSGDLNRVSVTYLVGAPSE